MKIGQKRWTRDELILVLKLYFNQSFGKMHSRNSEVISLANLLGRTPGSIAYKLVNFASMDTVLQVRGIKGASNVSNLDREIWKEFLNNQLLLEAESEKLLSIIENKTVKTPFVITEDDLFEKGKTGDQIIRARIDQAYFREIILGTYNNTCCITGIKQSELLIAGHIIPWSVDEKNRLNPKNGMLMNALHDRAFDKGLITVTPEFKIVISSALLNSKESEFFHSQFFKYHNQEIILPSKSLPGLNFLKYHNDFIFKG